MIRVKGVKLYSSMEVCSMLGIPRDKLNRECKIRHIGHRRIGTVNYYTQYQIDRLKNYAPYMISVRAFAKKYSIPVSFVHKIIDEYDKDPNQSRIKRLVDKNTTFIEWKSCRRIVSRYYDEFFNELEDDNYAISKEKINEAIQLAISAESGKYISAAQLKVLYDVDKGVLKEISMHHPEYIVNPNVSNVSKLKYHTEVITFLTKHRGYSRVDLRKVYCMTDIRQMYSWSLDRTMRILKFCGIEGKRIGRNLVIYNERDIKKLEKFREDYLMIDDYCSKYNLSRSEFISIINEYYSLGSMQNGSKKNPTYFFRRSEIDKIILEYKKQEADSVEQKAVRQKNKDRIKSALLNDDFVGFVKELLISDDDMIDLPVTRKLANDYILNYSSETYASNKYNTCSLIASRVRWSLQGLVKEITEYSNEEIYEYIESKRVFDGRADEVSSTDRALRTFCAFLDYVFTQTQCKYNTSFFFSTPYIGKVNNAYSDDEWEKFLRYITDIDKHVRKAEKDMKYAECWLFAIFHSFLSWRKKDYLKMPSPSISFVNQDGQINESMAAMLSTNMRNLCDGLTTDKTGSPLRFIEVPRPLLVPFATALLICNSYCKGNLIFSENFINGYENYFDRRCFFRDEMRGFSFGSMRANKTIESGIWVKGNLMPDVATSAYSIATMIRSHMHDVGQFSQTTTRYIVGDPTLQFDKDLQVAFSKRGLFGFNAENILNIITMGESQAMSVLQRTEAVVIVNKVFPPAIAEKMAENMLRNRDLKEAFISEWIRDGNKMKEDLLQAVSSDCNSHTDGVICGRGKPCEYKSFEKCYECFYGLYTIQIIAEIGRLAEDLIKELIEIDDTSTAEKNHKILLERRLARLMNILIIARDHFDDKYINSLLRKEQLTECIKLLEGK